MSAPRTIPANTSLLLVGTSSFSKTFILPTISTNPGRLLIFKDIYGTFSTSSVFLSTTGLDGFENNGSTMRLATNYGAWTLLNDAVTRWYLVDSYKNTMLVSTLAVAAGGGGGTSSLSVLPDVRYSFLSTNYSSGNVNNIGTASGTYGAASISGGTYTSASPGFITFTIGTGYIQAPSVTSIKTIIMIVRLTNTSTWSYLLDARGGLGSGYWASEIGPDWLNNSTYYRDSVQRAYVNGTSYQELNDNIWHHICLVYPTGFTDDVTFMARTSQNETVGGSCAEIMEFTVALTQQQIKDNFNFFASRFGWTPV